MSLVLRRLPYVVMEKHPSSSHPPRASSSRLIHHQAYLDVARDVEAYPYRQHDHLGDPVGPVALVLLPPAPPLRELVAAAAAERAGSPGAAQHAVAVAAAAAAVAG